MIVKTKTLTCRRTKRDSNVNDNWDLIEKRICYENRDRMKDEVDERAKCKRDWISKTTICDLIKSKSSKKKENELDLNSKFELSEDW